MFTRAFIREKIEKQKMSKFCVPKIWKTLKNIFDRGH